MFEMDVARFIARKSMTGWVPYSEEAIEAWRKCGVGELVEFKVNKKRNMRYHALYWVMCGKIADNHELFVNAMMVHKTFKQMLGMVEYRRLPFCGMPIEIEESTGLPAMDADEWHLYFRSCIEIVDRYIIPGAGEDLYNELAHL